MFKFAGPHTHGLHMHVCCSQHSVIQTPDTNKKLGDKTNGDFFDKAYHIHKNNIYVEFQNQHSLAGPNGGQVQNGPLDVFLMQQLVGRKYKAVHLFLNVSVIINIFYVVKTSSKNLS